MKSIATLIKIHKKNLDEIASQKSKAEEELHYIVTKKDKLILESQQEIEKYHGSEYADILANYLKEFRNKKLELDKSIDLYNNHIKGLESRLRNEFSEMKKFEIIQKNRLAKEAKKAQKQEIERLDELNTGKYVRDLKN